MVANVFLVIIPNQKKIVAALLAGQSPDPKLGKAGKERSVHNNYLTLPVIVLMISNHYPLLFATRFNWVIVAIVLALGPIIRHFFNERHAGRGSPWWVWGAASLGMIAIGVVVGRRSARNKDGIARGRSNLRQCPGDHPFAMQHVPCRRAGVGRHRHRAERHPAGR